MTVVLVAVVAAALFFDFTNGFHDAANAIATSISTRALSPRSALAMAAILNVVGGLLSTTVATTIATGIVIPRAVTLPILLAGLAAAIAWNLITWYFGLPSSSSHCLIGGIAGAVATDFGLAGVHWSGIVLKVLIPTVVSPLLGFVVGVGLAVAIGWAFRRTNPTRTHRVFQKAQLLSAGAMALSHGLNDAQKTMGVITLALFVHGSIAAPDVPLWVKLACAMAIGIGTAVGGQRIIRTIGMGLVKMTPADGFAAQTGASLVMQTAAWLGAPISTTHVATTTIMGVGAAHRVRAVRWGVTREIVVAWVLTLPASAAIGALFAGALNLCGLQ